MTTTDTGARPRRPGAPAATTPRPGVPAAKTPRPGVPAAEDRRVAVGRGRRPGRARRGVRQRRRGRHRRCERAAARPRSGRPGGAGRSPWTPDASPWTPVDEPLARARTAGRRAGLRAAVAPPAPVAVPRAPFLADGAALVVAGVLGVLVLNTKINENSFRLDDLHQRRPRWTCRSSSSPGSWPTWSRRATCAAAAPRLGLVPAGTPALHQPARRPGGRRTAAGHRAASLRRCRLDRAGEPCRRRGPDHDPSRPRSCHCAPPRSERAGVAGSPRPAGTSPRGRTVGGAPGHAGTPAGAIRSARRCASYPAPAPRGAGTAGPFRRTPESQESTSATGRRTSDRAADGTGTTAAGTAPARARPPAPLRARVRHRGPPGRARPAEVGARSAVRGTGDGRGGAVTRTPAARPAARGG